MKPTRSLPLAGVLLALVATTLVVVGSAAVFPAPAEAQSADCVATGSTLDEAKDAYAAACTAPRVDCDPIDGTWQCSSGVIGDSAPGGITSPDPTPEPTPAPVTPPPTTPAPVTPTPTAEPSQPTPAPTAPATGECVARGASLGGAIAAYAAACREPRVDCDLADGTWMCSSGVLGNTAPGGGRPTDPTDTADPTLTPTVTSPDGCQANSSGQVDLNNDLISLHYDHAPDRDDGHATAAGKEVATTIGFTPWVIGGAYGADNANTYRSASEPVMDAVWGSANWVNADADWDAAVQRTADRWQTTLRGCGDIWIAEGGQSDLSAAIVRELKRRIPDLDTNARIHLVQHSQWNEDQARNADLAYVKQTTDYIRIPDGNGGGNGTADFNEQDYNGPFNESALNGRNRAGWEAAFAYYAPENERLDFSDTVELMAILGVGTNDVNDVEDFADRFIRAAISESTPIPTPADPDPARDLDAIPDRLVEAVDGVVIERTYPITDGPDNNPMKGWNSGWSDDRPESTVGFQYIKWSDLEPRNGVFDFDAVEDVINRPGSRDRHLILRLYCDWWGADEKSRGCPDWIYSEVGVDRIQGDNGRYITDYNDPRYVNEAIQAIEALAGRYDDDPRLYTFELGIIGYWGEWHTYGSQVDGRPYDISPVTEARILDAYLTSFDRVRVMGRYPYRSTLRDTTQIGFHNDYFRPNNGHSAEFDENVAAGSRWLEGPIGGEIPPGLTSADFDNLYTTPQGEQMIDTGHYSTMKSSSVARRHAEEHMTLHRRFGYNYQIETATYSASQSPNGQTGVALSVKNVGVAPFYYDWQVQFGLLAANGSAIAVTDVTSYDLRNAKPGDVFNLAGAIALDDVAAGDYRVGVRIVQPGASAPKTAGWGLDARHTYILFANELPVIDGSWSEANALTGGWSILGSTSVG